MVKCYTVCRSAGDYNRMQESPSCCLLQLGELTASLQRCMVISRGWYVLINVVVIAQQGTQQRKIDRQRIVLNSPLVITQTKP